LSPRWFAKAAHVGSFSYKIFGFSWLHIAHIVVVWQFLPSAFVFFYSDENKPTRTASCASLAGHGSHLFIDSYKQRLSFIRWNSWIIKSIYPSTASNFLLHLAHDKRYSEI
jgi:hypothetical protein